MTKVIRKYRNIYIFILILSLIGLSSGYMYYQTQSKEVKNIITIFKEKYNITDQTIILNRICELLVRKPSSFVKTNELNIKTR